MDQAHICILVAIAVYLGGLLVMGAMYSKNNQTVGDYYLGGRKLGPFVAAMSAEASDMSSWLLMGLPGVAFATGIADAFWTALGLGIGTYLNWLLVAKRLRHYSAVNNSVTVPDFFENRFRDKKHVLLAISAIIIVVFFVPYVGSGFSACGKLFSSLFGIDYKVAMCIAAVIIIAYTAIGGFLAASTTDFVQSIIMTIALIVVVFFGISCCGGLNQVGETANQFDGYLSLNHLFNLDTTSAATYTGVGGGLAGTKSDYNVLTIISTMAWGLGYFGMPHILLRFMATKDPEKIKLSRRISTVWVFISMAVAIFIGVIALTMFNGGSLGAQDMTVVSAAGIPAIDTEKAIIAIALKMSGNGIAPALLAGLIFAGILACTMSTCDSQMLAASSSVSENILHTVFGIKMSQRAQMIAARITLVVIAIIGIVIAWDQNSSVFQIVSFAWAGFGAAFGPIVLCALFWKRANKYGAIVGMLGGGIMVFVWKFLIKPMGGVFGIYELLPAFLVGLILCVVVSLLTPAPEREIMEEFELVKAMTKKKAKSE